MSTEKDVKTALCRVLVDQIGLAYGYANQLVNGHAKPSLAAATQIEDVTGIPARAWIDGTFVEHATPLRPFVREPLWHGENGQRFDEQKRHQCVLDLDRAHELKTDRALANWVRRWHDNVRNSIWRQPSA